MLYTIFDTVNGRLMDFNNYTDSCTVVDTFTDWRHINDDWYPVYNHKGVYIGYMTEVGFTTKEE